MEGRISATDAALDELRSLGRRHGPLMLFQSGGCCEGSSPQCLRWGELLLGPNDLHLGDVDSTPVYIDAEMYGRWNEPRLLIDVAEGAADTMSLEGLDGVHFFLVRPVDQSRAAAIRAALPRSSVDRAMGSRRLYATKLANGDSGGADATPG